MPKIESIESLSQIGGRIAKKPEKPVDPAVETAKALRALADAIEQQSACLTQSQESLMQAIRDAAKPTPSKSVEVRLPAVQEHRVTFEYDTQGRVVAATIKARRGQ